MGNRVVPVDGPGAAEDHRLDHVRGAVARHPVLWFVVLAYALAWVCWLPLLADRQDWVSWSVSPCLHLAGAVGPAAAAVIVTAAVSGREGLRNLLRRTLARRGRLPWLALAVLAPLVLFTVAALAAWLVGGARPDLGRFGAGTEYPGLPLVGYWLASLVFYGYGEEIGWRGFLQPALQGRRSALRAAAAVSVVWAGWHLPLFGITAGHRSVPAAGFVGFCLSLLVAALVLAWLYLHSGGNLLVVAVFHAGYDIATNTPTSTTLIPILMGAAITVAGLATIRALRKALPAVYYRGPAAVVPTWRGVTP
jgi:membrane protease YdiL (CAAX protease family)